MTKRSIGRYEIRRELGRGGMGTLYVAHDPLLERDVAVKVLPSYLADDPEFAARFAAEAKAIAGLAHYAIIPVHDYGVDGTWSYFVMRLLAGGSLRHRIAVGPMSLAECSRVIYRVASALDKAHSRGIVHRDVKPSNIIFDEDDLPYLGDFGLVRMAEGSENFTRTGNVLGTPTYMSPEQVEETADIDGRTDVYSLGVVLYEMLSGQAPYQHDSSARLMMMHVDEPIPDITQERPDLPPGIQAIINTALAKDRAERYETAGALAEALNTLAEQQARAAERRKKTRAAAPAPAASDGQEATPDSEPAPTKALPGAPDPTVAVKAPPERPAPSPQPQAAPAVARPAPRRPRPRWALALGALLLIAVVAGAAYLASRAGEQRADPIAAGDDLSPTLARIMDRGQIAVGVGEGWLPFSAQVGDEFDGFEVDLIEAVIERLVGPEIDIKFVANTTVSRFPMLLDGDVDLMIRRASNTVSRQTEMGLLFTGNYFLDGQRLLVRADSSIGDWNQLDNGIVCVMQGTVYEQQLSDFHQGAGLGFDIRAVANLDDAWAEFEDGRCDGFSGDWSLLLMQMGQAADPDRYAIVGGAISWEPLAIVVRGDDPAFRLEVDRALDQVLDDGTWQRLYDRWFDDERDWTIEQMRAEPAINR